ncbi:MAG TPA: pitrilysin family protein [Nannocystaceae bacterium]|nr:pitrilysin family protein [Nannocystaceae bacterium]
MNTATTTLRKLSISRLARLALFTAVASLSVGACGKKKEEVVVPEPEPAPPPPEPVVEAPKRVYQDPPPPTDPRPVQFPDLQSFTTKNGLQVFVVENHEVPLVSVQMVVRAGTMDDRQLAEMTASMLGEGTKKRKKAQIDESIEYVGASLSAGAGVHETFLTTRVLKRDLGLALDLMADELLNPAFPEDALAKLKDKAKTGLKAMKSDPGELADTLFDMVTYPAGHPYGRPLPTDAEIDAVTLDGVKKFHDTFYRSNNAFVILSGDITQAEAEPLVTKYFGKWKHIEGAAPPNPLNAFKAESYKHPDKLVVHVVDRPASAQSEIRIGNLALARKHPDWIKMDLASTILGGGTTGRLFLDVREEKGLTYGIYSRMTSGQAPGTWMIWTKTKTKTTGEMLKAVFGHIAKMRGEAPTEKEYEDAVKQTVGAFPLQIETAEQIAGRVKTIVTYGLATDYYKTYRDEVLKVQLGDVQGMARKYMRDRPHIVIVGTAKKIEDQIKDALPEAEIVLYDTDLNRIQK